MQSTRLMRNQNSGAFSFSLRPAMLTSFGDFTIRATSFLTPARTRLKRFYFPGLCSARNTPASVVPARDRLALLEALVMEMKNPTTAKAREFAMEAVARFQAKERAAGMEGLLFNFLEK